MTTDSWTAAGSARSWLSLAARALQCDVSVIAGRGHAASFAALGGTSLQAMEFAALAERICGRVVDPGAVLGPEPLAAVVSAAARCPRRPGAGGPAAGLSASEMTPTQQAMLVSTELYGGAPFRLLFSADIRGPLDDARLTRALAAITERHPALRTVFTRDARGALAGRVLPSWQPRLRCQQLPPGTGTDLVAAVQGLLAPAAAGLLRPFEQPPVVFVLSRAADGSRAVLSLLAHHALLDGWSIGLLWRELAAEYAAPGALPGSAPPCAPAAGPAGHAVQERARALDGLPGALALPSDLTRPARRDLDGTRLVFGLSDAARRGCESLARRLGLTRNAVLVAAWALVIARRAGVPGLVMGMPAAGRPAAGTRGLIGQRTNLLAVPCQPGDGGSVASYLHRVAAAVRDALAAAQVPFEDLVAALGLGGDESRGPLVQVAFAAHDELIPARLEAGELSLAIAEGHCGGAAFDALLYVQRWAEGPRLALEYAVGVLSPGEAAELAGALDHALAELAAHPDGPLADVRTITRAQRRRLDVLGAGPAPAAARGLWPLIEEAARRRPAAVAVRDAAPARDLTYQDLLRAAAVQSAELAAAGVTAGDCVALALAPSAREIVAVLAVLRLGAAYTGVDPGTPPAVLAGMLDAARVRVVLGEPERMPGLPGDRILLPACDPWQAAASGGPVPPAAAPCPGQIAYIAFTSGSTGIPKGTRVPHRGVTRLVARPGYLRDGACERFMRLAPLAFDASTLEIFAPLAAGGTIEVFPGPHLAAAGIADFVRSRQVTGLWLTAGLFRLVADYHPDAFAGVRQLLTGGDVVPPAQVAAVLRACPGLRVTNGYGPTENTTFTTVHHVDDPSEVQGPLPIGRPVPGTGLAVLDADQRLVPPGGIGELYAAGDGLAAGYAGLPAETDRAFGCRSPDLPGVRLYRTGDLVRWDAAGRLCFLGRRDGQVKIRGFRIELEQVARVLRGHPAVRDVAVLAAGPASGERRLLAALVPAGGGLVTESVRELAARSLPAQAVPSLWAVIAELPVTRNGKLDERLLHELAAGPGSRAAAPSPAAPPPAALSPAGSAAAAADDVEQAIASAWTAVLGRAPASASDSFFAAGGDSLQLMRLAAILRRSLPGSDVTVGDLYACQAIGDLAERLRARGAGLLSAGAPR